MPMMLSLVVAALPLIQAPEAPFVEKPVELETPMVTLADGCVRAGTKALMWQNRENNLEIVAEGHAVAQFQIRVKPSHPGWQPFVNFKTSVVTGVVMRTYAFGMTTEKKGLFTQTVSVEGSNAVVVSRFDAAEGVPLDEIILPVGLPMDVAAGRRLRFTDGGGKTTDVTFPSAADWCPNGDATKNLWEVQGYVENPVEVTFDPDHPARSYTLRFVPGGLKSIKLIRSRGTGYMYLNLGPGAEGRDHRMVVSFGRTAKPASSDCVVDGINFTKNNAFEVPRWGRCNILNNPSFESNSRYWHGGCFEPSMLDDRLVRDARSGRYAMKNGVGMSFGVPTKPNRKYTFSCWAKAVDGDGGTVRIETFNYTWSGGNVTKSLPLKTGTRDWQRVSQTIDWPYRGLALSVGVQKAGGDILIDDVQFEEGERATDFEMPPFGVVLRTDAPDGLWGDVGQTFNPRLVIRGTAGAKGVAKVSVEDFFGRQTWCGSVPFLLGADGECVVPACPESAVGAKGVNRIRVELDTGDGRPFVDHVRLARFRYATGREPNRELHQIEGMGWMTRNMLNYSEVNWRRYTKQGVAVHVRSCGDWWGPYGEKLRKDVADWAIGHGGRVRQEVFPCAVRRKNVRHPIYTYMNEEGIAWDNMPDVTKGYGPDELAAVERAVHRLVREQSWCRDWVGTSELGVQWLMTKNHDYRAYARLMMAAHRGLKRANPQARFYAHGTCNAGQQGRAELHEFMEATKAVDPTWAWDGLQVHPYRGHPEFPSLEGDLEKLYADMARHNMPQGVVSADEGAYFFPLIVKEWNDIAPWAGTLPKDMYRQMHVPGYDLGWGERVATAMLLRYNLQCYRFLPRIRNVTSWNLFTLDVYSPWAIYVGTAAETEILGSAKFLKSLRFGDGARAYFFDDGRDGAVAAVWKFNVALDKGVEKAAEMRVDPAFLDGCEVFDMMANRCRTVGGRLPLSNYPVYLRAPIVKFDALVKAVETCTTSDDGKTRKLYDPPAVEIARCDETPDWSAVKPFPLPYVDLERETKRRGLKWGGPDDLTAACKMAWNEKGLFLKVAVRDDIFLIDRSTYEYGEQQWYACEGVQVFFDNLGDARENFAMEMVGYSDDDSSYELLPTSEKTAVVYRRLAPDIQQTGGVGDPLKSGVLVPEVRCDFRWDAAKKVRVYEAFFPARQLMPLPLKEGTKFGCSFCVYDRDEPGKYAKQCITDVPSKEGAAYEHPHLFSNFVLTR